MTERLGSYGKVYGVGHQAVADIFSGPVLVEEKVDGSQFSMGLRGGQLVCRSRNVQLDIHDAGMFDRAVESASWIAQDFVEGWTRCEYLRTPKHNTLSYDRIPRHHLVLFDVDKGNQQYFDLGEKRAIAEDLGLEAVPTVSYGLIEGPEHIKELMQRKSFLGGEVVEGLVFKAYGRFLDDGKTMMAKYVSESFKETHRSDWKKRHPAATDIKQHLIAMFRQPARFEKAVQHLRDAGQLQNDPRDIGPLMKELARDLLEECAGEMADELFKWAKKDVVRGVTKGFPEWYKERLVASAFEHAHDARGQS